MRGVGCSSPPPSPHGPPGGALREGGGGGGPAAPPCGQGAAGPVLSKVFAGRWGRASGAPLGPFGASRFRWRPAGASGRSQVEVSQRLVCDFKTATPSFLSLSGCSLVESTNLPTAFISLSYIL